MDDLILPGGRPVKPRRKARCDPRIGLDIAVGYDGQVEVEGPLEIVELGQGHWKLVNADAWDRLLLTAMQQATAELEEAKGETAEERLVRRKQQARDRRN